MQSLMFLMIDLILSPRKVTQLYPEVCYNNKGFIQMKLLEKRIVNVSILIDIFYI